MKNDKKCVWAYQVVETKTPQGIENEVTKFINNNLNEDQRRTYKVAQDDRRSEKPHAVIFYDRNGVVPTELSTLPINIVEYQADGNSKSDLESICDDAREWLNGLSTIQSLSTRITMSNSKNPKELLVFYYPVSMKKGEG